MKQIESELRMVKKLLAQCKSGDADNVKVLESAVELLARLAKEVSSCRRESERMERFINEMDEDLAALERDMTGDARSEECRIQIRCYKCGDMISMIKNSSDFGCESVVCPRCREVLVSCEQLLGDEDHGRTVMH